MGFSPNSIQRDLRAIVIVLSALASLAGCTSGPRERPAADTGPSIGAASASGPLTRSLEQFVDLACQDLATRLPSHPTIQHSPHRQVLGLGPVKVTGFADQTPFQQAYESLRTQLMRSQPLMDSFSMVEVSREDGADLLGSAAGADRQFLEADGSNSRDVRVSSYHPDDVFVLSANFSRSRAADGREQSLRFEAQVLHPRTRTVIVRSEFLRDLVWDAGNSQWRVVW